MTYTSGVVHRARQNKQVRFLVVGLINTGVDFLFFNAVLYTFRTHIWVANLCSTSFAMCLSFALNKTAVFKDAKRFSHAQFIGFLVVTLTGLWGLQTGAVLVISSFIRPIVPAGLPLWIVPNVAKSCAIVLSAVWNYLWYDRVIFARRSAFIEKIAEWM